MDDNLAALIRDAGREGTGSALAFDMVNKQRYVGMVADEDATADWIRMWPLDEKGERSDVPMFIRREHIVRAQWDSRAMDSWYS